MKDGGFCDHFSDRMSTARHEKAESLSVGAHYIH